MTPRRVESPVVDPNEATLTMATAPKAKRKGRFLGGLIRVSQRKNREGSSFMSPTQQREVIEDYARRNGDTVGVWYDETDSVSGGTVDRVGLKAALYDALNGVTDGVIVAKVNRFARTKRAGEGLIYDLIAAGKSFVAAANHLDSAGARLDRGSEVYLDFLLRQAEWEREDLQSNWLDVRHRHVGEGVAVRACYGYTKGADRRLVPIKGEARWVVKIFTWRAEGRSWSTIARELNRKNVRPPQSLSPRVTASTQWVPQHVTTIVRNRKYLGELNQGDAVNPKAHPPIVTRDLWELAQRTPSTGAKNGKAFYMLTGFIRCAGCGGRMTGDTHGEDRFYRCRKTHSWGTCTAPAFVNADDIEGEVVSDFERRTLGRSRGKFRATVREVNANLDQARQAVEEARAELREYTRVTTAARAELGGEDFQQGLDDRTEVVRLARFAESEALAATMGVRLPVKVREDWPNMSDEERAVILAQTYHCVIVRCPTKWKAQEPASTRMRLWVVGDPSRPRDLPGRPVGPRPPNSPPKVSRLTPIVW